MQCNGEIRTFPVALLVAAIGLTCAYGTVDYDLMRSSFVQMWGEREVYKYDAWRSLIKNLSASDDSEKIKKVNDFYNRRILFKESFEIWGDKDYWPTPNESLGKGASHCTGYALAKYYTLKLAGISNEKMRMVYVRAGTGASSSVPPVAHMVVAYYPEPDAEPLILDNLIGDIRPASRRQDLTPIFSFNEDGIFNKITASDSALIAGVNRYSKWESYLRKASEQGFR